MMVASKLKGHRIKLLGWVGGGGGGGGQAVKLGWAKKLNWGGGGGELMYVYEYIGCQRKSAKEKEWVGRWWLLSTGM